MRGDRWQGLLLDVTAAPRCPGIVVEVTGGGRLQIRQGPTVVFLARLDAGHYHVDYRRLPGYDPILPPVRSADARRIGGGPAEDRGLRWVYRFADLLTASGVGPLYPGRWLLQPSAPNLRYVEAAASVRKSAGTAERWSELLVDDDAGQLDWYVHGGSGLVLAMRPMSRADDARVKSYRKQVRSGTLPPILLWWVSVLDSYLLLDGHDRLAACLAEVVEPPLMTLTAVVDADEVQRCHAWSVRRHAETSAHIEREISKGTPGAADALVAERGRFADELVAPQLRAKTSRAWMLPGGVAQWEHVAAVTDLARVENHR
ncbi:hypothetical protein GA0070562_5134 [Micromonospora tulbaghiae]|uniref:Uncharacterized protein n=1 Tax=Micromonospora tulbaghiae TaxID=479978 RepID=A0ABY0KQT2_9ACTN|nr:hypothetical protein BAW75_01430 [Micromonospora chalcea]SCF01334.1 hypothetical protein GA0070562_5134 [Micromonospora tulbaghiae]